MRKTAIFIGILLIFTLIAALVAAPVVGMATEGENSKKPELTDEMKQKIERFNAERQQQLKKWKSLPDAKKAEIYKLYDQITDLQKKIVDKYSEYEIINKETANKIKERIDKINSKIKSENKMPILDM